MVIIVILYKMDEKFNKDLKKERGEILIKNIKEFYGNAIEAEKKADYNTSVTLFFKALAVLGDLFILRKEGFIPSNHSERFRVLEEKYHEIYELLDKNFSHYQESYSLKMNQEISKVIRKDVERIIKMLNI